MRKVYIVTLTGEERERLGALVSKGAARARAIKRAHILLLADEGKEDPIIAATLHASVSTVERIRKRFVERGVDGALTELPRPGGRRTLSGDGEAYLVALACSTPPGGRRQWTMQLLADRLIAMGTVETISDETVRRTLKKGASNHGSANNGASPR
jgi:transposase